MPLKSILGELFLLLGLATALAFVVNAFSPRGIALLGQWDTSEGVISARAKNQVILRELEIPDVSRAKELYDQGGVLFVDARGASLYAEGHIRGAVSLPVGEFDMHIEEFRKRYPLEQAIVTYCSGRECSDSHELAVRLFDAGFTNVSIFIDGFPAWEAEGLPVEP